MAKECTICKKRGKMVWRRVKLRAERYNPTVKRKQYPNLQWIKIPLEIKKEKFKKFAGKRVLACTKCIKTLAKRE
jgi:ribosomal protein L28